MNLRANKKRKGIAAAMLVLFTLLSVSGSYVHAGAVGNTINLSQEPPPANTNDGEALTAVPDLVRLSWDNLPSPDAVTVGPASRVVLRVANLSGKPIRVGLFFTADDGGQHSKKREIESISLDPSGSKAIRVDLRKFGFKLASLKCSGQLEATARAFLADRTQYRQSDSAALYFHPNLDGDASLLTFYGKQALLKRFNAGDFRGRLSQRDLTEPGVINTRVMFGGSGKPSDRVSDEDPGEPTELDDDDGTHTGAPPTATPPPSKVPTPEGSYNYTTNIRFLIRTVDSSVGIPDGPNEDGVEDYYQGANEGVPVIARGVHVRIWIPDSNDPDNDADWSQEFDADPATGSIEWSHTATAGFMMRVYGHCTDKNNNYVRIHDDPKDFTGLAGKTYAQTFLDFNPTPGGIDTYDVGSNQSEWTAMAALAFGLYRYNSGLSDKCFHAAIDDTTPGAASAHFGQSNANITNGRHYLRFGNADVDEDGNPATASTKYKFIVTHELGHAIAALYYGSHSEAINGGEPTDEAAYTYTGDTENACGQGGDFYSIDSKEWNWLGFREGFAHFISAKIWNTKDKEGTFTWFASAYDLNRYNFGASNNAGGRLENECVCIIVGCENESEGASTIGDWLRFLWDWYTTQPSVCADQPSKTDMLRLYRQVRLNGGLAKRNYYDKMQEAVNELDGDVSECLQTTSFEAWAAYNGIDH